MNAIAEQNLRQARHYFIDAGETRLCVSERGALDGPPLILTMGLGCQMTVWPDGLLDGLADRGFRVICFDNRDVGLSQKWRSQVRLDTRVAFVKHKLGLEFESNYTLYDMADDTAALIDALSLERVHIVGASMGGMIAQILAAEYPDRIASLTLLMSSNNSPKLPPPSVGLMMKLGWGGPGGHDEESAVRRGVGFWSAIQSPRYPTPLEVISDRIRAGYRRSYSPGGTLRQMQAILATGSLEAIDDRIQVPTLIVHGKHDPLIKSRSAKDMAATITSSALEIINGMGHDLPEPLFPEFIDLITANSRRAI